MWRSARWLSIAASGLIVLAVACGGDDKKDDKKSDSGAATGASATVVAVAGTPSGAASPTAGASGNSATRTAAAGSPTASPTSAATASNCFAGLRSYRFNGTLRLKMPAGLGGPPIDNVKMTGAFVSPDRTQTKLELGPGANDSVEAVTIGTTVYTRQGSGPWTKDAPNSGSFNFNPTDFCQTSPTQLEQAGIKPVKEKVNGVDAISYKVGKQDLQKLDQALSGQAGALTGLFDTFDMTISFTEKEKWPLKMRITAEQRSSEAMAFSIDLNFTDFNKPDIKVEAPQ